MDYSLIEDYGVNIYAVPENYMSLINTDYFFPSSYQSDLTFNLTDGVKDPI
jgi:hypothetical protein